MIPGQWERAIGAGIDGVPGWSQLPPKALARARTGWYGAVSPPSRLEELIQSGASWVFTPDDIYAIEFKGSGSGRTGDGAA